MGVAVLFYEVLLTGEGLPQLVDTKMSELHLANATNLCHLWFVRCIVFWAL